MTLDETIKEFTEWAKNDRDEMNYWLAQKNENDETSPLSYSDCKAFAEDAEASAERYEQIAEWLTELKNRREVSEIEKRSIEKCDKCSDVFDCPLYYPWLKE